MIHQWGDTQGVKGLKRSSSLAFTFWALTCSEFPPCPSRQQLCSGSPEFPSGSLRGSLCSETALSAHIPSARCSHLFTAVSRPGCRGRVVFLWWNSARPSLSHTLHSADASSEEGSLGSEAIGCMTRGGLAPHPVLAADPAAWEEAEWGVVNRKAASLAWPGEQGTSATTLSPGPGSQPSELATPPRLVWRFFQQLGVVSAAGRICPEVPPQECHGF